MTKKVGFYLAAIHLFLFAATVVYTVNSHLEQASLVWLAWFPVDLPWSFLNLLGGAEYSAWLESVASRSTLLGYFFYTPYLVHGVIGTLWWYFLPRIVTGFARRNRK